MKSLVFQLELLNNCTIYQGWVGKGNAALGRILMLSIDRIYFSYVVDRSNPYGYPHRENLIPIPIAYPRQPCNITDLTVGRIVVCP